MKLMIVAIAIFLSRDEVERKEKGCGVGGGGGFWGDIMQQGDKRERESKKKRRMVIEEQICGQSYTNFLASWRHYFPSSAIIPSLRSHSEAGDDGMIFIWHIQIPLQKCPPAERMQFPITFSSLSGGGRSGGRFSGEAIRRASCSCGWGPRSNWRLAYGRRSYIAGCEGKSCASAERNQETGKGKKRKLPIYFGRDKIIIESG
ncbi:hypothetical protein Fcan01_12688 [Folsomia candida]|uniref:Uncharacterized protein n=1 Tax=Folsomia candida TaxID=158441 RepID=A0A226E848_FOLCA|nr:hypothetical protein Fcan01_12688 [Folsomia candida]